MPCLGLADSAFDGLRDNLGCQSIPMDLRCNLDQFYHTYYEIVNNNTRGHVRLHSQPRIKLSQLPQ